MNLLEPPHPTTVTAVTPIKPGADLGLLRLAVTSALTALGTTFQWRFACAPDDEEAVVALAEELGLDHAGIVTDSKNVAATRNLLAAMGTGDYLLQLDADDQYAPGGLAQMKFQLDIDPGLVAAHGRAMDTDAEGLSVVFDPPGWWNTFNENVAIPGDLAARRAELHHAQKVWYRAPACLATYPIHPGAGLFRREAVLEVGGWDETCGNYFEDTLLVAKLQARHAWFITNGAVVLLYRKHMSGSLTGRFLTLGPADFEVLNDIAACYEDARVLDAPEPPFPTPKIDRRPRPILADNKPLELPDLGWQGDERPAMSLVDYFVTPLKERDEAAKTEAEYEAIEAAARAVPGVDTEDLDDQPDLTDPHVDLHALIDGFTSDSKDD